MFRNSSILIKISYRKYEKGKKTVYIIYFLKSIVQRVVNIFHNLFHIDCALALQGVQGYSQNNPHLESEVYTLKEKYYLVYITQE